MQKFLINVLVLTIRRLLANDVWEGLTALVADAEALDVPGHERRAWVIARCVGGKVADWLLNLALEVAVARLRSAS